MRRLVKHLIGISGVVFISSLLFLTLRNHSLSETPLSTHEKLDVLMEEVFNLMVAAHWRIEGSEVDSKREVVIIYLLEENGDQKDGIKNSLTFPELIEFQLISEGDQPAI